MIYAINTETKEHRIASKGSRISDAMQCYLKENEVLVTADADGWILHKGTECPLPYNAPCEVLRRDEQQGFKAYEKQVMPAEDWRWSHLGTLYDAVAYRPVIAESPKWDGKTWPPVEGTRVKIRRAIERKYRYGTVAASGESGEKIRIAVKTDCGQLVIYTGTGNGMVKPIEAGEEDEAVERMLADVKRMAERGLDVCNDESFARALYRMGYKK